MMLALSFNRGAAELTVKKAPFRLVWMTFSNTASSAAPMGVLPVIPALAKTMSSLPKSFGNIREEPLPVVGHGNVGAVAACLWPQFGDGFIERLLIAAGNR